MLGELLARRAAGGHRARRRRRARSSRRSWSVCQAMQDYDDDVAERVTDVVIDGLRAAAVSGGPTLHSAWASAKNDVGTRDR